MTKPTNTLYDDLHRWMQNLEQQLDCSDFISESYLIYLGNLHLTSFFFFFYWSFGGFYNQSPFLTYREVTGMRVRSKSSMLL